MKLLKSRGKILRIRPGHLANFSGGAGYMPFIIMYSVPASAIFNLVGSLVLFFCGKHMLQKDEDARAGLHPFTRYAYYHTGACIVIACIVAIALFFQGQTMLKGNWWLYAPQTIILAAGPLAAWGVSAVVLMRLMISRGACFSNLFVSGALYVLILLACIPLFLFFSALA